VQRRLKLDDPGLDLLPPGLHGALVLLGDIRLRHDDAVVLGQHAQDFAALADVLARDDLYGVAFFNALHGVRSSYSVSGASETIFMKPLSRSSRATGPKMRVPLGFLVSPSRITAALSSNLM